MSKHFDATVKKLVDTDPASWLRLLLGREVGPASVLNADLATVVSEADEILKIEADPPWLVHIEFQSSYDRSLPIRLQRYNLLVKYRHELPVQSIALLLRRAADGPILTGELRHHLPDGRQNHEFRYDVHRAWLVPVDEVLSGGLGTLPLAPLCDEASSDLPDVLHEVQRRLRQDAGSNGPDLWLSTCILMGLRYDPETLKRVGAMSRILEDSWTYRMIVDRGIAEGRAEGLQAGRAEGLLEAIIRLGTKRFGPPDESTRSALLAISDLKRLEVLCEQVVEVDRWDQLASGGSLSPNREGGSTDRPPQSERQG
jgi:predicted transposase YdaD